MSFNWLCPYCNHNSVVTDQNSTRQQFSFDHGYKYQTQLFRLDVIICPNEECKEASLSASLFDGVWRGGNCQPGEQRNSWQLAPISSARCFPSYVPAVIIQDYNEACLILHNSPKASATLSRRCLQGMIRDFWGIKEKTLYLEIDKIADKLDPETFDAIDSLRKLGNIGAHMEKDINTIIDVDSNEAELLVQLIETLIEEWYVKRHQRQEKMAKIKALAAEKDALKKASQDPPPPAA
ncbi:MULTISPECIES: DUF4145 domain-containing protein [Pseudomonas]|uniref:DUF4145 domain-containing protein n=1 Tax=Pseudomonas TaxID=286 RepID=UPI000C229549|nr:MULTISPECIES: DUF4145 domain-containing protein [Pseudomonas]PJH88503.1 hypothetical protein CVG87_12540 [Pseudomonas sp. WCS365]UII13479.1 hypothetical protein LRP86_00334 [Pseudomonas brassicacearum]